MQFSESGSTFCLEDSTVFAEISIVNSDRNKAFATQNFFSLKGQPGVIRKNITTENDSSDISLSAKNRVSPGNCNVGKSFLSTNFKAHLCDAIARMSRFPPAETTQKVPTAFA